MPMHRKQQHKEQEKHAREPENQVKQGRRLQLQEWHQQHEAAGYHCVQVYTVSSSSATFGVLGRD